MRTHQVENPEEIRKIIQSCKTCYVAMALNEIPYVLPMNFALMEDKVILHSAQHGRMWETLLKNPQICINWTLGEELAWQNVEVGCSYRVKSKSVIIEGKAVIIEDIEEKEHLMKVFMKQYSNLDFTFSTPALKNVGIITVQIEKMTAKIFGAKPNIPGSN